MTLFYPGRTTTITKEIQTNFATTMTTLGGTAMISQNYVTTTTSSVYLPPSTVYVVKTIVAVIKESNDFVSLGELNSYGLWGITMSLFVVAATLVVFMASM